MLGLFILRILGILMDQVPSQFIMWETDVADVGSPPKKNNNIQIVYVWGLGKFFFPVEAEPPDGDNLINYHKNVYRSDTSLALATTWSTRRSKL